jgi:hypothetical protein
MKVRNMVNKIIYYHVGFPTDKIPLETMFAIEKSLSEKNISFDTGCGFGNRDWELDWSLRGITPEKLLEYMKKKYPEIMKLAEVTMSIGDDQ